MVHRPFRLAEIFSKMVLIEGLRGGKSRLTVEKPLIVYKEPGVYMPEIYDIYGY